ncbi:hypothetical protein CCAL13119_00880 [Campylobacter sp. RM13119]|uniref:hypothetical protein n=1 Tax=Campylobacter californiensis TaxID=1032243 RepID=UPI00147270F7|nr:hypothetical protein [Campylobacter sp. RM13119]MBE3605514.1 hypothetical protein [Campylobacter sp. RM13119]
MKKILLILLTVINLFAINQQEIEELFSNGEYRKVCSNQVENFFKKTSDESIMSIYGISCLNIHELNRLASPMFKLVKTKEARENAAYFADILFKKKLLYHALIDNVDISYIRLPKSDYILSFIFDKFVKKEYILDGDEYIFKEKNSSTHYTLNVLKESQTNKIILKTFKDDELKSQIEYW